MAQQVKNTPAMQEKRALSLGWEDLLEEEMAAHSSILAWKIPWREESLGWQRIGLTEHARRGMRTVPQLLGTPSLNTP